MTMKQAYTCFKSIMKRKEQEMKFQAACLGAPMKETVGQEEKLSKDQLSFIQKTAEEALKNKGLVRHDNSSSKGKRG